MYRTMRVTSAIKHQNTKMAAKNSLSGTIELRFSCCDKESIGKYILEE